MQRCSSSGAGAEVIQRLNRGCAEVVHVQRWCMCRGVEVVEMRQYRQDDAGVLSVGAEVEQRTEEVVAEVRRWNRGGGRGAEVLSGCTEVHCSAELVQRWNKCVQKVQSWCRRCRRCRCRRCRGVEVEQRVEQRWCRCSGGAEGGTEGGAEGGTEVLLLQSC